MKKLRYIIAPIAVLAFLTITIGFAPQKAQASSQPQLSLPNNTYFAQATPTPGTPPPATPPPGTPEAKDDDSCESRSGVLGWIMCPVVKSLDSALDWLDNQIQALLEVDKTAYDNPSLYNAWRQIRNIAYIILLPIMLVMVIATAMGSELFSAYTVKKALPRMGAAVIFITLSYFICTFLIGFSNAVGTGTLGLLTSPFSDADSSASTLTLSSLFKPVVSGGGGIVGGPLSFMLGLGQGAGAAIGLIIVLWLFGGTLFLFIGIAFLVLLLRQVFIIALLLVAPLAILAWIFPGNDKLWKAWWSGFSKLLIMFPLIMAIIAVGRDMAWLVSNQQAGGLQGGFIEPFSKLALYMLPYAFIPFTFKFAGGAFATLSGMANDKSKGIFDRQRKGRAAKIQRTAQGNMFKQAPAGSFRSRLNTAGAGAMNIKQAGFDPRHIRTNMRTALKDASEAQADEFGEKSTSFRSIRGDDAKLSAAQFESREQIAQQLASSDRTRFADYTDDDGVEHNNRDRREQAVSQIMRSQKEVGHDTFQRARLKAQAKTGTGYQYTDANGQTQFDAARMLDDINITYGDDREGAEKALAEMRGSLAQSGQIAGVAGYGAWRTQLDNTNRRRGDAVTHAAAHNAIMDDAIDSAQPGQAVYGKPASAAAMGQAHARRIQTIAAGVAAGTHTMDQLSVATAGAAGIYDAMASSAPQNASAFRNEMMAAEITPTAIPMHDQNGAPLMVLDDDRQPTAEQVTSRAGNIHDLIRTQMGGNLEFVQRRKDFYTGQMSGAAAYQQQQQQQQQPSPTVTPTQNRFQGPQSPIG